MEDTPKEFQFYIRMPNFRLLGSIIKKKYPKVADPLKGKFYYSASIMDTALIQKVPFILDRNFAKANGTKNHVCTFCDTVVLGYEIKYYERFQIFK